MKNHVKIYLVAFGYSPGDWMPCEISSIERGSCKGNGTAVDVHHIEARGMGGSERRDVITNLIGLCRHCHDAYGDKVQYLDWLQYIHTDFMRREINKNPEETTRTSGPY